MLLVDSHCHLDYPKLAEDAEGAVDRAHAAGIGLMLTISTKIRQHAGVLEMADRYENVYCSAGTHPHYAQDEKDIPLEELVALTRHEKVVAIGEAGLDYYRNNSPAEDQRQVFRKHIAAARETGLPLVIHTRDADEETADILQDEMAKGEFPAVLHCFTAGRELAELGMKLGLYISFSGVLTFKKSDELREIAADMPADRILVETDAPFLAPEPFRGKRNEPAYVAHTAQRLAQVRGVSEDEIAKITSRNFFRLFSKVSAPAAFKPQLAA